MSPEVSDKDIRLYDDNIYISMKKIDKKSNTIIRILILIILSQTYLKR